MGLGHFGGGSEAASWLAREGALVTVTDSASEDRLTNSLESLSSVPIHRYRLGEHRKQDFVEADLLVVNPAVRPGNPWLELAEKAGVYLTSETDLFLENCPARVVAVTGSNGKSSTAAMIASILAASGRKTFLGGNIGKSLLGEVASMKGSDFVVLELSSFQLHRLSPGATMPETAVITNFTANHLDWHPDLHHYRAAKQRLLAEQPSCGTALFDPSAPGLAGWQELVQGQFIGPQSPSNLPSMRVCGHHNQSNAALAAATASCLGCTNNVIQAGLQRFRGLPDRLEPLETIRGRRFFNDSSSTTPESTMAALRTLEQPIWLVAGGADKGAAHDELVDCIARKAEGVVFFGQVADTLAHAVVARRVDFECYVVQTLKEAFTLGLERSSEDAAILLSPGFSSHDQFTNYRERGAMFATLVRSCRNRLA